MLIQLIIFILFTQNVLFAADGKFWPAKSMSGGSYKGVSTTSCGKPNPYYAAGVLCQCVDYTKLFYTTIYNMSVYDSNVGNLNGNANEYWSGGENNPTGWPSIFYRITDKSKALPDDVIVFNPGKCGYNATYGHVGIVTNVDINNDKITYIDNNGGSKCGEHATSEDNCFIRNISISDPNNCIKGFLSLQKPPTLTTSPIGDNKTEIIAKDKDGNNAEVDLGDEAFRRMLESQALEVVDETPSGSNTTIVTIKDGLTGDYGHINNISIPVTLPNSEKLNLTSTNEFIDKSKGHINGINKLRDSNVVHAVKPIGSNLPAFNIVYSINGAYFNPDDALTRLDAVMLIVEILRQLNKLTLVQNFNDKYANSGTDVPRNTGSIERLYLESAYDCEVDKTPPNCSLPSITTPNNFKFNPAPSDYNPLYGIPGDEGRSGLITREEFSAMMVRAYEKYFSVLSYKEFDQLTGPKDVDKIAPVFIEVMKKVNTKRMFNGKEIRIMNGEISNNNVYLNPKRYVSRGEAATMLSRIFLGL